MDQTHNYRWILMDALRHAGSVARRAQEATEGTDNTFLFDAAAGAIAEFADQHPAMRALATAALRRMT